MKIDLTDTTASKINKALVQGRRAIGTPAVGMVLTMVIVTDEENAYDSIKAAEEASHEHPSRTLVVIRRVSRSPRDRTGSRLDAEVRVGADAGTGETVVLRLYGDVGEHADSVVLPLLLPDAPVVVWWPVDAPEVPAKDSLGALAQRRITDMYAVEHPLRALEQRVASYAPGDTDLAWTRLTPWRSMLAAALDQARTQVVSAAVESEAENPSAELLARWLGVRLDVAVERVVTGGPVVTGVRLGTEKGEIIIDRPEGPLATLSLPGQPSRTLALKVRSTSELIAEELRRLDADEMYAIALRGDGPKESPGQGSRPASGGRGAGGTAGWGAGPTAGSGAGPTADSGSAPTAGGGAGPTAGGGAGPTAGGGSAPTAGSGAGPTAGGGSAPTAGSGARPTPGGGSGAGSGQGSEGASGHA